MKRFKNILLVAGDEGWKEAPLERAVALVPHWQKGKRPFSAWAGMLWR